MTARGLAVVPGERSDPRAGSWEQLLRASVRPEFRVDVYVAEPGDPVLFGPTCLVVGCTARGLQRADGLRGLCATGTPGCGAVAGNRHVR